LVAVCGIYADSSAGSVDQIFSWLEQSGSRIALAGVFGTIATGSSARVWAVNGVSLCDASGSSCVGNELDFGAVNGVTGAQSIGLAIEVGEPYNSSNTVVGLTFGSEGCDTCTMHTGIRFGGPLNFGQQAWSPFEPGATIMATVGSSQIANGIDFTSYTFTGNAFMSPGFVITGSGYVGIGTPSPLGNLDIENGASTAKLCLNGSCTITLSGLYAGWCEATGALGYSSPSDWNITTYALYNCHGAYPPTYPTTCVSGTHAETSFDNGAYYSGGGSGNGSAQYKFVVKCVYN
jgi:hypothetical protein